MTRSRPHPEQGTGAVILDLTPRLPTRSWSRGRRLKLALIRYRPGIRTLLGVFVVGVLLGGLGWQQQEEAQVEGHFERLIQAMSLDGGRFVRWETERGRRLLRLRGLYQGYEVRPDAPIPTIPLLTPLEQRLCELWVMTREKDAQPVERVLGVASLLLSGGAPGGKTQALTLLERLLERPGIPEVQRAQLMGDVAVARLAGGSMEGGLTLLAQALARAPRDPVLLYNMVQGVGLGLLPGDELALLARYLQEEPDILWRKHAEIRYQTLMDMTSSKTVLE